jgi:hypothetical protein
MSIEVACGDCNKSYRVKDELAGKTAKCGCGSKIAIPLPTPATPTIDLDEMLNDVPSPVESPFPAINSQGGQTLASLPKATPIKSATGSGFDFAKMMQGTGAKIGQILFAALVGAGIGYKATRREVLDDSSRFMYIAGGAVLGAVAGVFLTFRDAMKNRD